MPTRPSLPAVPPPQPTGADGDRGGIPGPIPTAANVAQNRPIPGPTRGQYRRPVPAKAKRTAGLVPIAPPGPATLFGLLAVAFSLNLAVQSRLNSVVTVVAVAALSGLILRHQARRQVGIYLPLAMALAAATVAVFRTSPWVVAPIFILIVGNLGLAVADGVFGSSAWSTILKHFGLSAVDTPSWLKRPIVTATSGRNSQGVVRGLLLASLAIVPLALLLASADAVFGQLLLQLFEESLWTHISLTGLLLLPLAIIVVAARRNPSDLGGTERRRPTFGTMTEGTIVLSAVGLLLGVWGALQIVVALGGAGRLLATADLTAAENARQGFFQLVAVTGLLIAVLVGVDRFSPRSQASEHRRFKLLTWLIGLETLGVVAATYSRLALYVHGFGHTMLRLSVSWFLAWLAAAMLVLLVTMNRSQNGTNEVAKRNGTARGMIVLAGLFALSFGIFNPESFVAERNIDRTVEGLELASADGGTVSRNPELDGRYLTRDLGTDAIPALVARLDDLDEPTRERMVEALCTNPQSTSGFGFLGSNRSVHKANEALATLSCP